MNLLLTGLLAGLLDALAAMILFLLMGNKDEGMLFRYIASAVYGKNAFVKGRSMIGMGLLFHFLIALFFVAIYSFLHTQVPWLNRHPMTAAIWYGIMVWFVMNLLVVPNSKAAPRPFSPVFALINMLILIITIGLPAAYLLR